MGGRTPILARYTEDFDCQRETAFWYVICDTEYDLQKLKAKRRNVIVNGIKNFDVHQISPVDYLNELYSVYCNAQASYKRSPVSINRFEQQFVNAPENRLYYAAFHKLTGTLAAYAIVVDNGKYINLSSMKADPEYEKYKVNAGLLNQIMVDFNPRIKNGCYISDGARNISHETNFQDYLEKYFGFRKAYCSLHVIYNPKMRFLFSIVFKAKNILFVLDRINLIHQVNSVIKMDEMCANSTIAGRTS